MSVENVKRYRRAVWIGGLLMVCLYLVAVGLLGASDYDQAVADHEWHCQMVSERVYPPDPSVDCSEPVQTLASNMVSQ